MMVAWKIPVVAILFMALTKFLIVMALTKFLIVM